MNMKKNNLFTMKIFKNIALVTAFAATLVSCSKSDDKYDNVGQFAAAVGVVHASPGSPALDVAFDNNRLGVTSFTFNKRVDYLRAYVGNRSFKVFNATTATTTPLISKDINFESGKYYTIFIADTASKMEIVTLRDSTRSAGRDSVRLRFVNMSPDAPALDLYIKGNPTPIATNITYKNTGNFFSLKAAANTEFEVRATGQNTLLATSDATNLVNGKIYTIWNSGYVNGSGAEGIRIRVTAFTHNPIFF